MDKAEYLDPVCCFDASQYIGLPDAEPCAAAVDVPDVVKELDRLQNSGHLEQAQKLLERWIGAARQSGDWRSELSLQSEVSRLIGQGASDIPPCFTRLFRNARPRRLSLCRAL